MSTATATTSTTTNTTDGPLFSTGLVGVLDAARQRAKATAEGDAERMRALLHEGLVWTTHRGVVYDLLHYVKVHSRVKLVWQRQTMTEVTLSLGEGVAVLACVAEDEVIRSGTPERHRMRLTQVWVLQAGVWRCIAGHAGPTVKLRDDRRTS